MKSRLEKIERETAGLLSAQVNDIPAIGEARALIEKLVGALKEISEMEGMTLIAPSLGDDCDKAHQIGAAKAFDQAACIARAALSEAERSGG